MPRTTTNASSLTARRLVLPLAVTLAAGLVLAALLAPTSARPAPSTSARAWESVTRLAVVKDARITENSGMSRSTYPRQTLFVHNDSGGGARFFAIGVGGRTQAAFGVPGAPAKDWEDMDSGPGHTLWFGDIGGNRSAVNVVRVKEPKRLASRALRHTSYVLTYPDGAHNAEAMMVQPRTGRVFIITKATSGAAIYRAPVTLSRTRPNALVKVADAPRGLSGADFAPGGNRFVLRQYHSAFVYSKVGGAGVQFKLPDAHTFGEAVTFTRRGALVFGAEGVNEWLWIARH
ncbi:hypothetical protein [Nocardioides sp.]|uniref:hypothetical protein n=1 Tax=Nocardioides sp. TaxID=35761 RepID=UPI003D0DC74A